MVKCESIYQKGKYYGRFPEDADFGKTDSQLWDEIVAEFGGGDEEVV
jgi:hypothetical protein